MLAIKRFGLSFTSNELRDLDHYLQMVSQITEILETLADRGILPFFQDLSSASTSVMVLFLKKVQVPAGIWLTVQLFHRFTLGQQVVAVSLLDRVLRCHEKASEDDPGAAAAFVARFIRRVLAAIGQEVDAMRQPSPAESDPISSVPEQNSAMDSLAAQLGPFTNMVPDFDLNTIDDQYWFVVPMGKFH
jgi:hypothetical protein